MSVSSHQKKLSSRAFSPAAVFFMGCVGIIVVGFFCLGWGDDRSVVPWDWKLLQGAWDGQFDKHATIIFSIRLPRLILGSLVGGCLALSGLIFQGLLQNPLADPFILGVSGGAGLAAVVIQLMGLHDPLILTAGAFIGGLGAVFFVERLAGIGGGLDRGRLILAGVVMNAFFGALIAVALVLSGQDLPRIFAWLMGSLNLPDPALYRPLGILSLIVMACVWAMSHPLNLLALGDLHAYHLGLNPDKAKRMALFAASLLTAIAVSLSGMIGFIGMFVPHAVRLLFGSDHSRLVPAATCLGAMLLMTTDTIVRLSPGGVELPVGTITALLGAPFFLWLLVRSSRASWWNASAGDIS
ncbi:MAG: iron ABC transporter permease [Candidatus Riflebacteria bacterium]|nr:iron ABC transporter permease [Candidatus Riflebacteria bacterium]